MDASLPKAAEALWDFLWPRTVHVSIMLAILFLLAPGAVTALTGRLSVSHLRTALEFLRTPNAQALGLDKLAPVATLFLVMVLLVVTSNVADWLGRSMPPVILWTSPNDFVANAPPDELLQIGLFFPNAHHVEDLPSIVDGIYDANSEGSGYAYWEERGALASAACERSKFYFVWALVCTVLGLRFKTARRPWPRMLLVTLLLACTFSLGTAYAVHAHRELVRGKLVVARHWLMAQSTIPVQDSMEIRRRQDDLESATTRVSSWWRLGLPSWSW